MDERTQVPHDRTHRAVRATCRPIAAPPPCRGDCALCRCDTDSWLVHSRACAGYPNHRPPSRCCRYIMTLHFTEYEKNQLFINSVVLIVLIIAKLPEMHGVRLFRINKGPDAE
ncbi:hypothetical protein EON67_08475 [archaeon]|nr:MAG: hypothetical protein EON67_08475 [archaeon]